MKYGSGGMARLEVSSIASGEHSKEFNREMIRQGDRIVNARTGQVMVKSRI